MATQTRTALKAWFETGDTPTQSQFSDFIDSVPNIQDDLNDSPANIIKTDLLIPTAQVLTLNSIPQQIVASPGVGKLIEPVDCLMHVIFNTTAYNTNTNTLLVVSGSNTPVMRQLTGLDATVDSYRKFEVAPAANPVNSQYVTNAALVIQVQVGDPLAGDSDIHIYLSYRIVTV